jgi:signal peptidase II
VVVLDQITKVWAVGSLTDRPPVQVLGSFFQFTLVYNEGGALGTRMGPSTYYLIMAIIVLPIILVYLYRNRHTPLLSLPLAFLAAGALGNLIDRIRLGKVVDFVDFDMFDIHIGDYFLDRFWAFNIADASISCSIAFLIVYTMFFHKPLPEAGGGSGVETPTQPPSETLS